jgi:hypothetical protein
VSDDLDKARAEGREAGRIDEILRQYGVHFDSINGSIEKSASAITELASEIRQLREEARLRDERVAVAAETLATETERRREELAGTTAGAEHKFTRRERTLALVIAVAAVVAPLVIVAHPFG